MRELRLRGRPPGIYIFLVAVCAGLGIMVAPSPIWLLAIPAAGLALAFTLLAVRAGSVRFALELTPEPVLELGSAFGRARAPLSEIAVVRRRRVSGGRGPSYDIWEALGEAGEPLARAADLGLRHEQLRALETELRLWHVTLERA